MMEKIKKLISKFLNKETISYVIFGVLTTVVDYVASYIFFYKMDMGEVVSNTIAWVLAVAFAYVTNKLFVFEARGKGFKTLMFEIISFAGARVITLLISNGFLLITSHIGIEFLLAKVLISVVVLVLNYIFSKLIVFKK